MPAAATSGQESHPLEPASAPKPLQTDSIDQDAMPDCDEETELLMPAGDSLRSEAEEMPCAGFVSQRVSAFASLSSNRSESLSIPSLSTPKDAPNRGLVSERIRVHQRLISGAAQGVVRAGVKLMK
jgi:hypothetical protein